MLSFRAFKILVWSVDGGGHQNIYNVFIRRDLMPYIGLVLHWKFIANFCQLFVIFQFSENFNVWSLIYVFGKYFDSLNLANFELRIMAKCGKIYCTGIMICKLCVVYTGSLLLVLMPGSAYLPLWYISVVSMWCICGVCWSEIDDFCHFCPLHCQSTEDDCEKKVGLSTALYLNL